MKTERLHIIHVIRIDGLHLMAIHGNLCLALRHPANTGPSREIVEKIVQAIEKELVNCGAFTEEEIQEIHLTEIKAGGGIKEWKEKEK